MLRTVKPKNDVVLANGIFLRRGAVAKVFITEKEWKFIAPIVEDLTPTGVEQPAPAGESKKVVSENDIQQNPKRGKKQTV